MNVYTYFEPLHPNHSKVVELWKQTWSKHGWYPVVLGESDYLKFPSWSEYDFRVQNLPTTNTMHYERACYRRWAAMSMVGGGVMTDYDVMNFGFTPAMAMLIDKGNIICHLLDSISPCVVIGSGLAFLSATIAFATYMPPPGAKHTSDMFISNAMRGCRPFFSAKVMCVEYLDPGWESYTLVHFPYSKVGVRKHKEISRLIANRNNEPK